MSIFDRGLCRVAFAALITVACGCAAQANSSTQTNRADQLAEAMTSTLDTFIPAAIDAVKSAPGIGIAVTGPKGLIYARGFGYADVEDEIPVTPDTLFYIASTTKSLTTTAAAMFEAHRQLNLNASVTKYLPELADTAALQDHEIKITDLLSCSFGHQSNDAFEFRTAYTGDYSRAKLLEIFGASVTGDTSFEYTNTGFIVASMILDDLEENGSWKESIERFVLKPLNLTHTTGYYSKTGDLPVAVGYDWRGELQRLPFAKLDSTMHAAGGHFSSAKDLARWAQVNMNRGRIGDIQYFPARVMDRIHTAHADVDASFYKYKRFEYELGWYRSDYEGDLLIHDFGTYPGYRSHLSYMPEHGIGVVVLTNGYSGSIFFADVIASYAYDIVLGKENLTEKYEKELADVVAMRERRDAGIEASNARFLDESPGAGRYAGVYEHPFYGRMVITAGGDALNVSFGLLSSKLRPYENDNTFIEELVPGSLHLITFEESDAGQMTLIFRNEIYARAAKAM